MDSISKHNEHANTFAGLKLSGLICEYAENPLGIDTDRPRFSWKANSSERGQYQTAYRIIVDCEQEKLDAGIGNMWDSGKVITDKSINISYSGSHLLSRRIYYWKVCIWDNDGKKSGFSDTATFEMGLLYKSDWNADWVGYPGGKCGESLLFRRKFIIEKTIARARVYISGLGFYEMHINGQKVGDHVLDPGCTEYSKRVLYTTYDITGYLKQGSNAVGVMVGNGWYSTTVLLCQINIDYTDGISECYTPATHRSGWFVTTGPILSNSIYDGEIYDARLERTGWDTPEYDTDKLNLRQYGWSVPNIMGGPGGKLVSQAIEPIKVVSNMQALKIINPIKGVYVFDMGQNMAGWVRLTVKGSAGTEIVLRYAENLYDNNTVNQENLRTALARDIYILKGGEMEIYEPRFTYHGFRYVQVEGFPGVPTIENITGCVVRSAVEKVGEFECSNDLVNKIHSNVVWTEAGNLHSIPTDCPQRDERQGWLNDATVRAEESVYNFNMARFFTKWIDDIEDTQDEFGAITDTAPFKWGNRPADPVSSSYLIIPWLVYLHYGDERLLERHYNGIEKWNDFLGTKADNYIINYSYYGDWASPAEDSVKGSLGDGAISATTPGILMSTGYYYYNAVLLSKMARVLGKEEDVWRFNLLAEKIKKAFNDKFLDTENGWYAQGSQASNVFPIYLGIVPEQFKKSVMENIVKDVVEKCNYHLSTGNLCTKYMLEMLAEEGYADVAFKLVTQTTYPSWGYMISQGATTIWERWEYSTGGAMNSHNHPMLATVGSWFYKYLAGIQAKEQSPGFGRFIIKPYFLGKLDFVNASVNTLRGTIVSKWKRDEETIEMEVTVPFNSEAEVYIPTFIEKSGTFIIYEGDTVIWSEGAPAASTKGIRVLKQIGEYILLEVGSGVYYFRCKHANQLISK